ncbi:AfsR/SARP family transcriptional regulator [Streptomyces buecherae]|uniref:AfsR/SARP family transcriptional regulator n=1 Tax=Streptomyces buecherae TaxID=2763006 RepID=UPI001E4E8808|nr:BTAD domain-containing putative transcriptional regulator [Streptomyces buecherae]
MRYLILGTTEAYDHRGQPLPVGGPRLRALLTSLAAHATRPATALVPARALIDDVWGDEPPHDAPAALQALVGRLRRNLGKPAIQSAPGGYRLAAAPDEIDLTVFEQRASAGRRALEAGDAATAAALLRDALALWRGPALADLPDRAVAAARADALHLTALHQRIDAELALGHGTDVIPELRELIAQHPLDEPFRAQLIRALRAADRSADALAAYEEARHTFADRLGTDPGSELRHLHAELLTGPPPPADPPHRRDTPPPPPGAGPGSGAGELGTRPAAQAVPADQATAAEQPAAAEPVPDEWPVRAGRGVSATPAPPVAPVGPASPAEGTQGGPDAQGAPRTPGAAGAGAGNGTAGAPRGNLRSRLTSFVGRRAEIQSLRWELDGARLVTLTGPGGSGKTRLSEEAAATVAATYPDGVWIAELAPLDSPADVSGAVLSAVGRRDTTLHAGGLEPRTAPESTSPTARLVEHCAHRRLLLILDNCEHVIEAAAELAETLLTHCPQVTVLATSREPLGVPGEAVRPVEPLAPAPAHQLFAERAAAVRPGFDPARDPETAGAVAEICRRLDGLPLAIELAAARLRMLSPRQIADRLDDRFRLLTSGSRTVLPRQQTLRAVVDWSWDLLDERERTVLLRASVFAGGWDLSAAEAVCSDAPPEPPARPDSARAPRSAAPAPATASADAIDPADVLDLLGALVDKSLLVVRHTPVAADGTGGDARYRMLETIHEYVSERVAESALANPRGRAERTVTARRHARYFRDLAQTAEPRLRSADQLPWLRRVETELDNVRAALHRCLTPAEHPATTATTRPTSPDHPASGGLSDNHDHSRSSHSGHNDHDHSHIHNHHGHHHDHDRGNGIADAELAIDLVFSLGWFWWLRDYRAEGAGWVRRALAFESAHHLAAHEPPGTRTPGPGAYASDTYASDTYVSDEDASHGTDDNGRNSAGLGSARTRTRAWPAIHEPDARGGSGAQPEFDGPPTADDPAAVARYWRRLDLQLLLYLLLSEQRSAEVLGDPEALAAARTIRDAYAGQRGKVGVRFPGLLWPFAGYLTDGHAGVAPLLDQAAENCRRYGDDWALGVTLMFRTHLTIDMTGGVHRVDRDWAELQEISRRVGDRWMLTQVNEASGELAAVHGRYAEARAHYREALRLARELGAYTETPFLISRLAELTFFCGDPTAATALLDQSDAEAERFGGVEARAFNGSLRASIELTRGDVASARALADQALAAARHASPPPQFTVVLSSLEGRIAAEEGDPRGGLRRLRDALADGSAANCTEVLLAHAAETTAYVLVKLGEQRAAARLLGAADGWRDRLPRTPLAQTTTDSTARAVGEAIGDAECAALRAAGRGLSASAAVALISDVLAASEPPPPGLTSVES